MPSIIKKDIIIDKQENWSDVCDKLYSQFGKGIYDAWLNNLSLVSLTQNEIVMSVPTAFIKDWILREYFNGKFKNINNTRTCIQKGIKQILLDTFPTLMSFQIIVDKNAIENNIDNKIEDTNNTTIKSISSNNNLYNIGIPLNNSYTFDNFVVGSSNKLAYQIAKNIATTNSIDLGTNPFFIYGGVGLGKTHLCQAMAWKIKETQPNKQVVYLSAEKFMFLFVQSLQEQDINTFKNRFRNIDVLIIDDIQFIVGKDKTQKEFFYTFETLINDNKQVVLACDKSPSNLIELDEKLKSRITGGLVVDIKEPDYQLRYDLITKKSKDLGLNINKDLIEYIAENIVSSGREIEGCLKRLQIHQDIMNIEITVDTINEILGDNISNNKKLITINDIQEKVSKYFDISLNDLKSDKRIKELVIPRHIAMYFSKKLTTKSFPEIAKCFNGKNHATVIHAVKKIEELLQTDLEINKFITEIDKQLK